MGQDHAHNKQPMQPISELHKRIEAPPINPNLIKIINVITQTDTISSRIINDYIKCDPGLTTAVIAAANAAIYARYPQVDTVEQSIARIGYYRLVETIIPRMINAALDLKQCPSFSPPQYWWTHLITARVVELAVDNTSKPLPWAAFRSSVYVAALLRRMGLLILIHHYAREMDRVLTQAREPDGISVAHILQERYHTDHYSIALACFKKWNMPDNLTVAMRLFCHPERTTEYDLFFDLLNWADAFVATSFVDRIPHVAERAGLSQQASVSISNKIIDDIAYYHKLCLQYGHH